MTPEKVEQKVFELFDELAGDFDPDVYIELCAIIGESFMMRAEDD